MQGILRHGVCDVKSRSKPEDMANGSAEARVRSLLAVMT